MEPQLLPPDPADLAATLQHALVEWRDAYLDRLHISPHVKSQAACLLKILARHGLLVVHAPGPKQLADAAVVPLSAQYWHRAAAQAPTSAEQAFNQREAYNHVVNQLYATKEYIKKLEATQHDPFSA